METLTEFDGTLDQLEAVLKGLDVSTDGKSSLEAAKTQASAGFAICSLLYSAFVPSFVLGFVG